MKLDYAIIDAIDSVSIFWKDLEGRFLGCNRYVYEFAGLMQREDVIGKTDFELPWNSEASKIRELDQAVVRENKCYQMEETIKLEDGREIMFLTSKTPLVKNNKIIGIVGVSIDITKSKKLEKELRRTKQDLNDILKYMSKDS